MSTSQVSKALVKSMKIPRVYSDTGLFSALYILLILLDFSFRYDSVHQKYKRLNRYVSHCEILWHSVTLCSEFSALEYLIQR